MFLDADARGRSALLGRVRAEVEIWVSMGRVRSW